MAQEREDSATGNERPEGGWEGKGGEGECSVGGFMR